MSFIELKPKPSYFIKSIAEQGYLLETALADLIDNSIYADAKEVNIFFSAINTKPSLFIGDNGVGMTKEKLIESMRMPTQSMSNIRESNDLGRFGLGLKTASFSQARKFTIISKVRDEDKYYGFCWDLLNLENDWNLLVLEEDDIKNYLQLYGEKKEKSSLNSETKVTTLIIWEELFRETSEDDFSRYLNFEVREHLSLVFHRFLERKIIRISIGNNELSGFNPFPEEISRLQQYRFFPSDSFVVQGSVLPFSVLKSRTDEDLRNWVLPGRNLSDMEGIYLYRGDRLIYFGGWAKMHRRHQYLKLGRLRIDIKNSHDHLFQINVAKSTMQIPKSFAIQIREIIKELGEQAKTVYYQRQPNEEKNLNNNLPEKVLKKVINNQGVVFVLNKENEAFQKIHKGLISKGDKRLFELYLSNIVNILNKYVNIDNGHVEEIIGQTKTTLSKEDLQMFRDLGLSDYLLKELLS